MGNIDWDLTVCMYVFTIIAITNEITG